MKRTEENKALLNFIGLLIEQIAIDHERATDFYEQGEKDGYVNRIFKIMGNVTALQSEVQKAKGLMEK